MPERKRSPLAVLVRVMVPALVAVAVAAQGLAGGQAAPQAPAAASAAERPNFSGSWALARQISDDVQSKIEAATGGKSLSGAGGIGGVTLLPKGSTKKDVERIELRQFLLDRVTLFEAIEIEQSPTEIKLIHGPEDVRIFYFDREHLRNDRQGRKLRCHTVWQGQQLVIEELGDNKVKIVDVLTLVPARNQLIHGLRIEGGAMEKPLELALAYDKVKR